MQICKTAELKKIYLDKSIYNKFLVFDNYQKVYKRYNRIYVSKASLSHIIFNKFWSIFILLKLSYLYDSITLTYHTIGFNPQVAY